MVLGIVKSIPYANKLGQEEFRAYQASKRSGHLIVVLKETGFTLQEKPPSIAVARFM